MSEEAEVLESKEEMKEKRGRMLQVLCILSWIFIGSAFLYNITLFTGGQASREEMDNQIITLIEFSESFGLDDATIKDVVATADLTNDNFYLHYSSKLVFAIIGFFAVFQMWKLQKTGFWVYIAYSLIPIGITYYILGEVPSTIQNVVWDLIMAGLFIVLYGSQLKRMT